MKLTPAIKATHDGVHRVVSLHETYRRVWPLMPRIGMTDFQDLTDYDGVAIPVWSVRRQHDVSGQLTAYGKGTGSIQSQVSAMMEAIERYSAEQLPCTVQRASYNQMCQRGDPAIVPRQVTDGVDTTWSEDIVIEWLPGTDLTTDEEVWLPANCVLLHPEPLGPRLVPMRTSNGLASGNTFEEAVCHSLCEMIERDAWSLAWLRAVTIPYISMIAPLMVRHPGTTWSDCDITPDGDLFPEVDGATLPDNVREIVARFECAGVTIIIRDITSDIGIPVFLAASKETGDDRNCFVYYGTGSHPSAQVAVIRALTECAQKRLIAIRAPYQHRLGRQFTGTTTYLSQQKILFAPTSEKRDFSSIPTYHNQDILYDINIVLTQLSAAKLCQVIAADLTLPDLEIPVVRVLIPGIEDWSAFDFSPRYCMLGYRGQKYLDGNQ